MVKDTALFSDVAKTLSYEAILRHPFDFATIIYRKAMRVMSSPGKDARFDPPEFWERQHEINEGRWKDRPAEMKVVYGMDHAAYLDLEKRRTDKEVRSLGLLQQLR